MPEISVPTGGVPHALFLAYDGRGVPGNLEPNERVDIRLRDGALFKARRAVEVRWEWSPAGPHPSDIVAWRHTPYEMPSASGGEPVPPAMPRKHNHYFKSVAGLTHIDVYRVLALFAVTDQALGHAIKKLLVAGGRGAGKDFRKDVQEAVDTLQRRLEMLDEDA